MKSFFWLPENGVKVSSWAAVGILAVFLLQILYFDHVYSRVLAQPISAYELVLDYGGSGDIGKAADLANTAKVPLFISGGNWWTIRYARQHGFFRDLEVFNDGRPRTTDQNARFTALYLKEKGYHRVLLLTSWDHMPRALFLTRLYLLGSSIQVLPCVNTPPPNYWWQYKLPWLQMFKFWGSLGRVVLHQLGVNHWPPPQWMP